MPLYHIVVGIVNGVVAASSVATGVTAPVAVGIVVAMGIANALVGGVERSALAAAAARNGVTWVPFTGGPTTGDAAIA